MQANPIDLDEFMHVSPHCISLDEGLPFDVFTIFEGSRLPVLYAAKGQVASSLAKDGFSNISNFFIRVKDVESYQAFVQSLLLDVRRINRLSGVQRTSIVAEAVRFTMYSSFRTDDTTSIVQATRKLGSHIAELMEDVDVKLTELQGLLHHDYGTFTHSTNVALYATLLSKKLETSTISNEDVAIGGLLHDLGKLSIDTRILNKASKLDDREFRVIKRHPLDGFRRLTCEAGITKCQLLMAYQHHEKVDGSGYPVGLFDQEISLPARICAVVDVYEALTSNRPYRRALGPKIAIDIMEKQSKEHFDRNILDCWKTIVLESTPTDQLCHAN
jgi:HD-GYP domain-containing protein (c-di-GMP phosphodiesterase class II)